MWKTNSADCLGGMHHIFLRCGLSAFFQCLSHGLVRERVDVLQLDHASGQQAQRPAPALDGWGGAGQRNQLGLLLAIELALIKPLADPVRAESGLQALQDEALPQALHGRDANIQRRNDPLVRPGWAALGLVGLEQDLRVLEPADIGFAPGEHLLQLVALRCRQGHSVLLHRSPPACRQRTNRPASHQITADAALGVFGTALSAPPRRGCRPRVRKSIRAGEMAMAPSRVDRQLAATLAADVVGYSRPMAATWT